MPRPIDARYQDPADLVWLHAATALGWTVQRSADAYASWDGQGTLTLASAEYLDPDDCLAQMLFHEICHLLVSGEEARKQVDWGLDNTSARDLVYEHATNRLQAALAQAYGLRSFMAVTTVWRTYYDALPHDPLAPGADPAIELARAGRERASQEPWRAVLHKALSATAALAEVLRESAPEDSLWRPAEALQPTTAEDCLRCGACCHRGFDVVDVAPGERFAQRHPDLIEVRSAEHCVVPRPNGRCVALDGEGSTEAPYLCRHYEDRPQSCRDFELGGDACLEARQRCALPLRA